MLLLASVFRKVIKGVNNVQPYVTVVSGRSVVREAKVRWERKS